MKLQGALDRVADGCRQGGSKQGIAGWVRNQGRGCTGEVRLAGIKTQCSLQVRGNTGCVRNTGAPDALASWCQRCQAAGRGARLCRRGKGAGAARGIGRLAQHRDAQVCGKGGDPQGDGQDGVEVELEQHAGKARGHALRALGQLQQDDQVLRREKGGAGGGGRCSEGLAWQAGGREALAWMRGVQGLFRACRRAPTCGCLAAVHACRAAPAPCPTSLPGTLRNPLPSRARGHRGAPARWA